MGMIVSFLLTACNSKDSFPQLTHIPCKVSDSDLWGMVGVDGKILFENEFENEPSIAVNGVFSVLNSNDELEYFTADSKPKQIGQKAYLDGGYYTEGVIPVVDSNHQILFITKEGDIAFDLKEVKGKKVINVSPLFSDGLMAFCTEDNKWGYINNKGKVVIEPVYSFANEFNEGYAVVATTRKIEQFPYSEETAYVIDKKGNKIITLPKSKSDPVMEKFVYDECINWNHTMFNVNGKDSFSNPNVFVFNYQDGYAPFVETDENENIYQGKKFGIIDQKGSFIIRAKYDGISRVIGNKFWAKQQTSDNNFNIDCLDKEGNKLFTIKNIKNFYPFSKNSILIQEDNETYYFVNEKGQKENPQTFYTARLPLSFFADNYPLAAPNPFLSYTTPRVYPHYFVQTDNPLW